MHDKRCFLKCFNCRCSQIRATAASSLQAVLAAHHETRCDALGSTVNEFCHTVLRACSAKETVHAGLLVDFLKAALPLLQSKIIASICEALLRLFSLAAVRSRLSFATAWHHLILVLLFFVIDCSRD